MNDEQTADAISASGEHLLAVVEERIAELQQLMPTQEELRWLKERKLEDERARWLKEKIRQHAPWVAVVFALCGGLFAWLAWLAQNNIHVSGK